MPWRRRCSGFALEVGAMALPNKLTPDDMRQSVFLQTSPD
jgi:hypothetical protein